MKRQRISALILASGQSRRFGPDNKLLSAVQGHPLLAHVLDLAASSSCEDSYIVCAEGSHEITTVIDRYKAKPIFNPAPEIGQGQSLALGISHLAKRPFDGVIVLLGDMPFVPASHIQNLINKSASSDIVWSAVNGRDQAPTLFMRPVFEALETLNGDKGARSLDLSRFQQSRIELLAENARDIDTQSDLSKS